MNKQLNYWNDHINSVANKISSTVGVLNKLKKFLPTNILKQIYSSLILPRLYYCNLIWGYKPKRISNIQKRAIRIICKQKYNAHTEPLFKKLNMLTVEDIHISKKLSFTINSKMINYLHIFGHICSMQIPITEQKIKIHISH